jgi:MFS family permease
MKQAVTRTFRALRHRNFRLYVAGQAVSNCGTWMQKVAQAWLVLELTGSGTMLGLTAAAQQLPLLLIGAWGGLLADRFDKRWVLVWASVGGAVPALALGLLTATDTVQLWMVWVLAVLLGVVDAVEKPARHSLASEIVPVEDVANAVSLSNVVLNAGKVVGPAIAGGLIVLVGLPVSFFVNAVSYAAVVAASLLMHTDHLRPTPATRERGQLREGLRYIRREPELLAPMVLLTVTGLVVYEWTVTLPLMAHEVFDGNAGTVGLFFSAMGAGAIAGGLGVAGSLRGSPRGLAVAALALSASLVALALSPTLPIALVLMVVLGAASAAFRVVSSTWMQLRAEPHMRGRVVGWLLIAIIGTTPVGGPLLGWIAETFGARVAVGVGGVVTALTAVGYLAYLRTRTPAAPDVRRLDHHAPQSARSA